MVVSAYAFGGVPQQALAAVLSSARPCVSPDLLDEYRGVPQELLASRKVTVEQFRSLVAGIAAFVAEARLVVPVHAVRLCRDPKDDMLLECCRAARAQHLITGDRDLLALASLVADTPGLRPLRVLAPRAYLDAIQRPRPRRR